MASKTKPAPTKKNRTPTELLDKSILLLERGVTNKDERLLRRFLRNNVLLRKSLKTSDLLTSYQFYVPSDTPNYDVVIASLSAIPAASTEGGALFADVESAMDVEEEEEEESTTLSDTKRGEKRLTVLPEVEIFMHLLALSRVVRQARASSTSSSLLPGCLDSASKLVARLSTFSRHTLDIIGSKAYMLYSLVHELHSVTSYISIRPALFTAYRTACLRRDDMGRATLVNLLLRNYIRFNHYELALKLLDGIPEQYPAAVSNNQFVRHLYYVGRVYAVSCDYGEAHQRLNVVRWFVMFCVPPFSLPSLSLLRCFSLFLVFCFFCFFSLPRASFFFFFFLFFFFSFLSSTIIHHPSSTQLCVQALRKAPQRTARGFRIAAQQLDCLVQLLIGEVPERSLFNALDTREALSPYLELTQAVRLGELSAFSSTVEKHAARFQADGNYSLVQRLRHSVIKTGLRNISLSYSRISFADIAMKLRLDTAKDAEYMCAKAIRDGVIEASLNHDDGYLASSTSGNVYSTTQPQEQFHQRIEFCLTVHNDAVKGMQYPPKDHDKDSDRKKKIDEADKEMEELVAEAEQDGLDEDEDE